MDHAKMEEVVRMLWMIITAAVSLDTRGRIAVLVSQFSSRIIYKGIALDSLLFSITHSNKKFDFPKKIQ